MMALGAVLALLGCGTLCSRLAGPTAQNRPCSARFSTPIMHRSQMVSVLWVFMLGQVSFGSVWLGPS
jgi:hypothetical protein